MAILVGYVRVSGEGQRENNSIPFQKSEIVNYCIRNNHVLFTTMEDVESGGSMDARSGLLLALQIIYAGFADGIIVHKLDRLARNVLDAERLRLDLETKNKQLVSISDPVDTATDSGTLVYQMLSSVAEFEKNRIKRRCAEGRFQKKLNGGYCGGRPPYGYRPVRGKLVPFEPEQQVIRHVKELYNSGLKESHIAAELNLSGYRTQSGKVWGQQQVNRILSYVSKIPLSHEPIDEASNNPEVQLIRRINELLRGKIGLKEIASTLNEEGFKPKSGQRWTPVQVLKMTQSAPGAIEYQPGKAV